MNQQELKKLETKLLTLLKDYIPKKSSVILGISGGPDSVFLHHIFNKLSEIHPLKIIVGHVNHMLRGIESNLDEKFVKELAKEKKHIFHSLKKDVNSTSKKLKKGLEEVGRDIRYKFFKDLAKKYKSQFIVTAHQADDNLETILLNLTRGASLKGLAGMKEIEKISEKLHLLRPLLGISKEKILDYLKTKKLKFRTDKSNEDLTYKRNYIRHKIIPSLKKINPNIPDTVAKNSQHIRDIVALLETSALDWIKKNKLNKSLTKFNAKSLKKIPHQLQKEIILQIYKLKNGNTQNIETPHIEEVLSILNKNTGNKKKRLGKIIFYIKNNIISLFPA